MFCTVLNWLFLWLVACDQELSRTCPPKSDLLTGMVKRMLPHIRVGCLKHSITMEVCKQHALLMQSTWLGHGRFARALCVRVRHAMQWDCVKSALLGNKHTYAMEV